MSTAFSARLRQARQACRLTQETVAEYLDVSTLTISRWERGEIAPNVLYVQRLCQIYHITPNDLLAEGNMFSTCTSMLSHGEHHITVMIQLSVVAKTEKDRGSPQKNAHLRASPPLRLLPDTGKQARKLESPVMTIHIQEVS